MTSRSSSKTLSKSTRLFQAASFVKTPSKMSQERFKAFLDLFHPFPMAFNWPLNGVLVAFEWFLNGVWMIFCR